MKVRNITTRDPQCIGPDASICDAARKMRTLDVGLLPVCDDDRLAGTITDRDIAIRGVADGLDPHTTTVRQVMSPGVICCSEDDDVEVAARLMEDKQIRRLPVLNDQGRLVGIVSLGDLAVRTRQDELVGEVLGRVSEPPDASA